MPVFKSVSPAGLARKLLKERSVNGRNSMGSEIPALKALVWNGGAQLELGSCSTFTSKKFAGVSWKAIPAGEYGDAVYQGRVPGALAHLTPVAGQSVFLGVTPGELSLEVPDESINAIIKIGQAAPAEGTTGPCHDLIIEFEVISVP